jgi:hypothetical protein
MHQNVMRPETAGPEVPMPNRRLAFLITAGIVTALGAGTLVLSRTTETGHRILKTVGIELHAQAAVAAPAPDLAAFAPPGTASPFSIAFAPSKVIRTAKLTLEVSDWKAFEHGLRDLASRHGYLAGADVSTTDAGRRKASLTLKVEASRFDRALDEFRALGTVKAEKLGAEDVGQAYTDLETRRANKRVAAARLRDIIANRTGRLEEVIEAERALAGVTEEIERLDAQKRSWDHQIAYSTLTADVAEPLAKAEGPSLWKPLKDALLDTRTTLIALTAFLLEAVLVLAPWGLLGWMGWKAFRKRRKAAA